MNGKGDTYRPVNKKQYDKNYERIFMKTRSPNSKYYITKADGEFMPQFRGLPCEVCGSTHMTCGHHNIPKGRCKALRYELKNMTVLCPTHHTMSNDLAAHSTNAFAVREYVNWFEKNRPEQYRWLMDNKNIVRKFTFKQAFENLKQGREAWI